MTLSSDATIQIYGLYSTAAIGFDLGDAEAFAECFTREGSFSSGGKEPIVGREDLREYVTRRFQESPGLAHHVCNVLIENSDDGVRGRAYGIILGPAEDGSLVVRTLGTYEDELVEEDGRWRFSSRRFTPRVAPGHVGRTVAGPSPA